MLETTETHQGRNEHSPAAGQFHTGLLVAAARQARGWTRPQLAKALGWKTRRLVAVEEGREPASPEELDAAARTLGFGPWALVLTEEFFRNGGQVSWGPQAAGLSLSWESFVLGLEAGRVVSRFFQLLASTHATAGLAEARP